MTLTETERRDAAIGETPKRRASIMIDWRTEKLARELAPGCSLSAALRVAVAIASEKENAK